MNTNETEGWSIKKKWTWRHCGLDGLVFIVLCWMGWSLMLGENKPIVLMWWPVGSWRDIGWGSVGNKMVYGVEMEGKGFFLVRKKEVKGSF